MNRYEQMVVGFLRESQKNPQKRHSTIHKTSFFVMSSLIIEINA